MNPSKILFLAIAALLLQSCQQPRLSQDQIQLEAIQPRVPVFAQKKDNPILELTLSVTDTVQQYHLTRFEINLEGTTEVSDLAKLQIFKIPENPEEEHTLFGETQEIASTTSIEGNQSLSPGQHKFVVYGSLNGIPQLTNKVQAQVSALEFGEAGGFQPNQPASTHPQRIGLALLQKNQHEVHTYRIPGLTTTNEGTLIAVYDNRYENSADLQGHVDVGMSRSTDGGQNWEEMKVIMDMGQYGGRPQDQNGIGDPAVLVDRTNNTIWVAALWLSANEGARAWTASKPGMAPEETGQFVLVKSEDDGKTWSDPINITEQVKKPEWRLFFNGPGNGISMKDGTLVFAAQFRDADGMPHSTIIYSKDQGETWKVGTGAKSNTTEAQVVELQDGSLMLNMRDNRNHPNNEAHDGQHGRSVAVTHDLGHTWEEHPTSRKALPESTCMASIIGSEVPGHGSVLFFSNPNSTTDRSNMTIKASLDYGMTWKDANQLLLYQPDGFGYSCLTMVDDEHVGILYEGVRDLYFEKVHISEILE